jgi:hypothetical protein
MPEETLEYGLGSISGSASIANTGAEFIAIIWLVILGFYLYSAICMLYMARKTKTKNGWFAFVPILNNVLMIQIAQKPVWWIILMFVPFVNIVISVMVMYYMVKRLGYPGWWVVLMLIPIVNLVVWGILAFSKKGTVSAPPAAPQAPIAPNTSV